MLPIYPTAWIVCWSLDERSVCCRFNPDGKPDRNGRQVWLTPFRALHRYSGSAEWWHVTYRGVEYTTGTDCD